MTETTEDLLLGGRVRLEQPAEGLRAAIDAVLLAAAIPARAPEAVLELGCGTGAALLCLAARVPGLVLHGGELDAGLAEMARRNAAGLGASIVAGDIRGALPECRHAFANPPYWPGGSASPIALRRNAAHEAEAGLEDWAGALARGLVRRGMASMILPAARFGQAAAALRGAGCGSQAGDFAGDQGRAGAGPAFIRPGATRGRWQLYRCGRGGAAARPGPATRLSRPTRAVIAHITKPGT